MRSAHLEFHDFICYIREYATYDRQRKILWLAERQEYDLLPAFTYYFRRSIPLKFNTFEANHEVDLPNKEKVFKFVCCDCWLLDPFLEIRGMAEDQ